MYIVTGGAGFIGSAVVKKLNDEGITSILIVDNLGESEKWKNLRGLQFSDYISKFELLERVVNDDVPDIVDAVIHMGACSSTTETDADYMLENNYQYTKALAEWCLMDGIRFIYASSGATYGDGSLGFSDDDSVTPDLLPLNVYGYSKQLFDTWALRTGALERIVGLKFFNVFGPNEYHKGNMASVVYKAYHQIKESGELRLFKSYRDDYKDGEQLRDFVYVKDCTSVIWSLIKDSSINGLFNVGTGTARSWNDLGNAVFKAMGQPAKITYIDMPEELQGKYQYYTQAEVSKLNKALPDSNFRSLEESVADYIKNHLTNANPHL